MPSLPFLEAAAKLAARVEHELHQRLASGGALEQKAKSHYAEQGFAGRWYNGVVTGLQGKHDGIRALQKLQLGELEERIKRVEQAIAEIVRKKLPKAQALEDDARRRKKLAALRLAKHGKARKLARLRAHLARLKIEMARRAPAASCFQAVLMR